MNLMKFFKKSKPETPTKPIDNYSTESGDNLANEIIPVLKEIMLTGKNNLANGKPIKEVVVLVNGHQTRCKRISPFDDKYTRANMIHSSIYSEYTKNDLLELYNLYDYSFLFWKYRYKDDIRIKIYKIVNDVVVSSDNISKEKFIEILNLRNFRFSEGDTILNNIILKMKDIISNGNMDSFRFFNPSELVVSLKRPYELPYTNSIGKFKFGVSSRDGGFDVDFEWRFSQLFKFKREDVVFVKYGHNYPISESKLSEYLSVLQDINKIKNDELLREKFDLLETQTSENFKLSTNYMEKDINTLSEDGLAILKSVLLKESEDRVREYVLKTLESKLSRNLSFFLLELSREFKGLDKNVNLYDIHKEIKEIWGVAPADDPSPFASGLTGPACPIRDDFWN